MKPFNKSIVIFFLGITSNAFAANEYTVQKGDTLSEIALRVFGRKVYGKNGGLKKLLALNPKLKRSSQLSIGDKVIVDHVQERVISAQEEISPETSPEIPYALPKESPNHLEPWAGSDPGQKDQTVEEIYAKEPDFRYPSELSAGVLFGQSTLEVEYSNQTKPGGKWQTPLIFGYRVGAEVPFSRSWGLGLTMKSQKFAYRSSSGKLIGKSLAQSDIDFLILKRWKNLRVGVGMSVLSLNPVLYNDTDKLYSIVTLPGQFIIAQIKYTKAFGKFSAAPRIRGGVLSEAQGYDLKPGFSWASIVSMAAGYKHKFFSLFVEPSVDMRMLSHSEGSSQTSQTWLAMGATAEL